MDGIVGDVVLVDFLGFLVDGGVVLMAAPEQ